ncbi:MAG: 3,4-dihydroxy-2-butanone-4-phosphate synthase, partial [Actinobacteria bacterium]|nr:3,4-dihydroxy-2-butanone-4-phosphate synthase [Actinomycetota bacterium]
MSSLRERIERFKSGEFVIVTDDESRENEGDLFLLASKATTEKLAFMIRHTSGVVCVAMTEARSRQLHLPLMVKHNQDTKRTAFTVTVDVKHGITTGISAEERANTIRALADNNSMAEDFIRPGHIFPLIAAEGGLRSRAGHTEAIIELCRRSDEIEVGAISELVNEDGSMMRGDSLRAFAESYAIPIITIAELQASLEKNDANKYGRDEKVVWAELPRKGGKWKIATFLGSGGVDHAVLKFGD